MNKTITITLNKIIFHIEEIAYQKLKEYLDSVRDHLGSDSDKDEVMADIEASIAEKFSARLSSAKQVITEDDVSELIKVMGTVEDFDQELEAGKKEQGGVSGAKEEKSEEKKAGEKTVKKLFRNPDDAIIAGICSGIAAYAGIDPLLVRLIFFASIFFGGTGIILYLILWLIIPKAVTGGQKLEMQGDPVTLAGIEQAVKKNVERIKNAKDNESVKSGLRRLIELPFLLIKLMFTVAGKIIKAVLPVIRILLGLALAFFPLIGIAFISFFGFISAFRLDHPYIVSDVPLTEFAHDPAFRLGVLAAYLIALIPLLFFILLGISLLRKKSAFNVLTAGGLLAVWMIAIVTASAIGFDYAPRIEQKVDEIRARDTIIRNYDLKDFSSISSDGNYTLEIKKGKNFAVAAQGLQKEIERMEIRVQESRLEVNQAPRRNGICFICLDHEPVKITVTMPELTAYRGEGVTRMKTSGFSGEELRIEMEDAARADINADYLNLIINEKDTSSLTFSGTSTAIQITLKDVARLNHTGAAAGLAKISLSDVSRAELKGRADKLSANLKDTSRLNAFSFPVNDAEITLTDVSKAEINAAKTIKAGLRDASRLNFTGKAKIESEVSGPGAKINKIENVMESDGEEFEDVYFEFEGGDDFSANGSDFYIEDKPIPNKEIQVTFPEENAL